jgi:hypothetical protein
MTAGPSATLRDRRSTSPAASRGARFLCIREEDLLRVGRLRPGRPTPPRCRTFLRCGPHRPRRRSPPQAEGHLAVLLQGVRQSDARRAPILRVSHRPAAKPGNREARTGTSLGRGSRRPSRRWSQETPSMARGCVGRSEEPSRYQRRCAASSQEPPSIARAARAADAMPVLVIPTRFLAPPRPKTATRQAAGIVVA